MKITRTFAMSPESIILVAFFLILIVVQGQEGKGFRSISFELVHRHDPRVSGDEVQVLDKFILVKELAYKDIDRHKRRTTWGSFQMPMQAGRDYESGEYFVQVKVGSPAQKFWLVVDTGSEFTWVNCKFDPTGAPSARKQNNRIDGKKVFLAHRSRTFQTVLCSSQRCKVDLKYLFATPACPNPSAFCQYDFKYIDGSSALGFFGSDTITVGLPDGKKGKIKNMLIGCTGEVHNGKTLNRHADGILGLGYSNDSFFAKTASDYGAKFSYCLVDHLSHRNVSSYITFGAAALPNAKLLTEVKTTEVVFVPPFYGVNVIGLSVGGQMLKIPPEVWDFDADGGLVIDSGTTLTLLAKPAFEPLAEILVKALDRFEKLDAREPFEFCYKADGFDESLVPRIAFHFAGGVRFEPPVKSYVIDVGPTEKCLAIVGAPGGSVLGNIIQQNHFWEFDFAKNTVGFAPSACH